MMKLLNYFLISLFFVCISSLALATNKLPIVANQGNLQQLQPGDRLVSPTGIPYGIGTTSAPASLQIIQSQTLSASAASFVFTSIPQTYSDLVLVVNGQATTSGGFNNVGIQFNGDTAADYESIGVQGAGSTVQTVSSISGGTSSIIGYVNDAASPANSSGHVELNIEQYAGTTFFKSYHSSGYLQIAQSTSGNYISFQSGSWRSTAAINSITLIPLTGGSFAAGTTAVLYGRGGTGGAGPGGNPGSPGAYQLIGSISGTGSSNTITFNNIPQNYQDLIIVGQGLTTAGTSSSVARMLFNNDSSADWLNQRTYSYTTGGPSGVGEVNVTGQYFGDIAGSSGGKATASEYSIINYTGTTFPHEVMGVYSLVVSGSPYLYIFNVASYWNTTPAAITRIDLVLGSGNWATGSVYNLYGRGGVSGGQTAASTTLPQGRLTLTSNTPIMISDVVNSQTIYYDCAPGKWIPYYNGQTDQLSNINACEVGDTMATSGSGVLNASDIFDVYWLGATGQICTPTNGSGGGWSSDTGGSLTARGTGYSQVHNTRGYWTNQNSITHCYNGATDEGPIAADQGTYIGSIYTTGAGTVTQQFNPAAAIGGTNTVLGLFNAYNRVTLSTVNMDSSNWTYGTAAWRALDGSNNNRINWLDGLGVSTPRFSIILPLTSTQFHGYNWGISLDSTTTAPSEEGSVHGWTAPTGQIFPATLISAFAPQIGFHYGQGVELGDGTGSYSIGVVPGEAIHLNLEQ